MWTNLNTRCTFSQDAEADCKPTSFTECREELGLWSV